MAPKLGLSSTVPVTDAQFDCGTPPTALPDDETLKRWTPDVLLDWGSDAWMSAQRCSFVNKYNRAYFFCNIKKDDSACKTLDELKDEQKKNGTTSQPK